MDNSGNINEKYRNLLSDEWLERSSNFIQRLDLNGNFKFVNQTLEGVEKADLIGSSVFDLVAKEERDMFINAFNRCKNELKTVKVRTENKYGVWLNIISPIISQGELSEISLISTDIEEIERIQSINQELREKSWQLQERVKELNCLYRVSQVLWERDISEGKRFIEISNIIRQSWQEPEDTSVKITIFEKDYYDDEFNAGEFIHIEKMEEGGQIEIHIHGETAKKGNVFLDEEYILISNLAHKFSRYISDKSLRKKLENSLNLLQIANEELEEYTYFVSHDLRSPVNLINGYVNLLKSDLYEDLDDSHKMYFDKIEQTIGKQQLLIDEILKLSKIGYNNQIHENKEKIGLKQIIQKLISNMSSSKIQFEYELGDLPEVWGNETELSSIFQNLMENAIKYKSEKPLKLDIWSQKNDINYYIYFRDNGIGFNQEQTSIIFKPFQRLDNAGDVEGTGLGLAFCSKILRNYGGKITAESKVGEGTTFIISYPINVR